MTFVLGAVCVVLLAGNVFQMMWNYRLMTRMTAPPGSKAFLAEQAARLAGKGPEAAKVAATLAKAVVPEVKEPGERFDTSF